MTLLKKTQREFSKLNTLTKAFNTNLSKSRANDPFRRLNQSLAVTQRRMASVVAQSRALNRSLEGGAAAGAVEEGALAAASRSGRRGGGLSRKRGAFHQHARSHFDLGGVGITNNMPLGAAMGAGLVAAGAYEAYQAGSEWSRQVASCSNAGIYFGRS